MAVAYSQNGVIVKGVFKPLDVMPKDGAGDQGDLYVYSADLNNVDLGNIIPVQTDDTNTFGSSSTIYKVFDNNTSTYISMSSVLECGFDFGLGNEKKICGVSVYYRYSSLHRYLVKASNDMENWDILAFVPCVRGPTWHSTSFNNEKYYRYYSFIFYNDGSQSIEIAVIHATDDASVIRQGSAPQLFIKKFDKWNFTQFPCGYDCEPVLAVYRKDGYNVSIPANIWGHTSSNIHVEAEFNIDEQIFNRNGRYTALIGWNNNWNAPIDVRIYDFQEGGIYYVTFSVTNTSNTTNYKSIKQTDFFARKTMKLIVDADKWKVYLDGELFIDASVSGYNYVADETFSTPFRPLGGMYNFGSSHQLGLKRLLMIDKDKNNLLCDLVAAKRTYDNTVGLFDRRTMCYYGFGSTYVGYVE